MCVGIICQQGHGCLFETMNGYDFDDTIFKGNSFRRFYFYCLVRLPYLVLYLPVQLFAAILHGLHILNKHRFLCVLEWFIVFVPRKRRLVQKFWNKNFKRVKSWYLQQKREDDLILSASPQYLVEVACERLGVSCIASQVDIKTGKTLGKHCHGKTKADIYRQHFGETELETFYSDSLSDTPMLRLAKEGYLVKGDKITLLYRDGSKITSGNLS